MSGPQAESANTVALIRPSGKPARGVGRFLRRAVRRIDGKVRNIASGITKMLSYCESRSDFMLTNLLLAAGKGHDGREKIER